jgi:hypothetical protein
MRGLVAAAVTGVLTSIGAISYAQSAPTVPLATQYGCNERPPPDSARNGSAPTLAIVRTYDGCVESTTTMYESPTLPLVRTYDGDRAPTIPGVTFLPTEYVSVEPNARLLARAIDDDLEWRVTETPAPGAPVVLPAIVIETAR